MLNPAEHVARAGGFCDSPIRTRIDKEGVLGIISRETRSQASSKELAVERLWS